MEIAIKKNGISIQGMVSPPPFNRPLTAEKCQNTCNKYSKRKQISTFSKKSARRLRRVLLSSFVPGKNYLSITCTLPAVPIPFHVAFILSFVSQIPISFFLCDYITKYDWEKLFKRFRMNLIRKNLCAIWRIELQKRKIPHLHLVGFGNSIEDVGEYWESWVSAVDNLLDWSGVPVSLSNGFLVYGFCAKFVTSSNWFKYLATHTLKHKKEQLGWVGRQWGVINSSQISNFESDNFHLSEIVSQKVIRAIRKMTKFKFLSADCRGNYTIFCNPETIRRLVEFYTPPAPF